MSQSRWHRVITHRVGPARIVAAALVVGGLSASLSMTGVAAAATNHASKTVVVTTVKNTKLGTILVSGGKTLYMLKPSKTACTAACLKFWPALALPAGVTKATAGSGTKASSLGTVMRSGGVRQVTYQGKALYFFAEDKKSGQVNGNKVNDTWGLWTVLVTVKPAATGGGGGGTTVTTVPTGGGTSF